MAEEVPPGCNEERESDAKVMASCNDDETRSFKDRLIVGPCESTGASTASEREGELRCVWICGSPERQDQNVNNHNLEKSRSDFILYSMHPCVALHLLCQEWNASRHCPPSRCATATQGYAAPPSPWVAAPFSVSAPSRLYGSSASIRPCRR